MNIDENQEHSLNNFNSNKKVNKRTVPSDHNSLFVNINMNIPKVHKERVTKFHVKDKDSLADFHSQTTLTSKFTEITTNKEISNNVKFRKWTKLLNSFIYKISRK